MFLEASLAYRMRPLCLRMLISVDKNISSFGSHGKLSEGCVRHIFFFKEEK